MTGKAGRTQCIALSWASVVLAAGLLAACAWDPPTIQRVPRETASLDAKAKSSAPVKKATSKSDANTGDEDEVALPEQETPPVDLTNFKERLVGLEPDEVAELMGPPDLERSEPPALIWQFRRPVCSVDVFLFDDGNGQAVDHVEVRGAQSDAVDEKQCFASVLKNGATSAKAASDKTASTTPLGNGGNGTAVPKPPAVPASSAARSANSASKAASNAGKAPGGQKFAPKKPSAILDDPTGDDEPPPPPAQPSSSSKAAASAAAAKGQAKAKASTAPAAPDGDLPTDLSE